MKVLKRPMFKYGGDVKKQGIMHGMNGLRNGGVATTMADATGMANGGIMRQRYQDGLSVQQQIEQQKAKTKALQGPKYTDKILDQKFNKFIDNYYGGNQATDLYNEVEMLAPPTTAAENVFMQNYSTPEGKKKIKEQFLTGEFGKEYGFGNTKNFRELQKQQEEFGIIPPRKNIESNETPEVNENEIYLSEEGGDKSDTKTPKPSQKETDAKRIKRAYDILGVDDAKKDAVYNALIDVSQGQGIDTKDISGSINRAIGALSKRADKVTDLKDKAKAAVASGTIQEMFRDDSSQYSKLARELVASGKYDNYADALGAVAKVNKDDVGAAISEQVTATRGGKVNDKIVRTAISTKFGSKYKGSIGSTVELDESIKDGKFTDVIDAVVKTKGIKAGDSSKDGLYVAGMTVVEIKKGKPSIRYTY